MSSTYENTAYGFSFQYPVTWTVEEVVGETVEDGVKLADAVILIQDRLKIAVQYQHKSDPTQIAWDGSLATGGMVFSGATLGDPVTVLGEETHKLVWTYNGGVKAIAVNTTGKGSGPVLSITLADSSAGHSSERASLRVGGAVSRAMCARPPGKRPGIGAGAGHRREARRSSGAAQPHGPEHRRDAAITQPLTGASKRLPRTSQHQSSFQNCNTLFSDGYTATALS